MIESVYKSWQETDHIGQINNAATAIEEIHRFATSYIYTFIKQIPSDWIPSCGPFY